MLLLSHSTASAASSPCSTLAVAGDWIIYRYLNAQCHDDNLPPLSDHPNAWDEEGLRLDLHRERRQQLGHLDQRRVRDEELVWSRLSWGEHTQPYGGRQH